MYFHYYGQLLHQQNIMQDFVRTGTYYAAIMENRSDFVGRVVVAVGPDSGILSLFATQVIKGKVEEVELPEKADILISNPIGGEIRTASYTNRALFRLGHPPSAKAKYGLQLRHYVSPNVLQL